MLDVAGIRGSKTVHFIRHGEGHHNVAGDQDYAAYKSEAFFDASLTDKGWHQVDELKRQLQAVDLVVSSPLTRALQTAVGLFIREAPIVACELCREHLGVHPCDRRRTRTQCKERFPTVDFGEIADEEDTLWKPEQRETHEEVVTRARRFLRWCSVFASEDANYAANMLALLRRLSDRPEQTIAVVGHGSFFHIAWQTFFAGKTPDWPRNCEVQTMSLTLETSTV